jgi:Cu/Ag efflux protein CusF
MPPRRGFPQQVDLHETNRKKNQMKIITIISALIALVALAIAPLQASDTSSGASTNESSKQMKFHGSITAIDMSANTVTIQTDKGTMTMSINQGTKFHGGTKGLSDLKIGDSISGTYMMDDSGKMMALSVKPYRSKT